jgi:beta-N-acetylhexosaminidase
MTSRFAGTRPLWRWGMLLCAVIWLAACAGRNSAALPTRGGTMPVPPATSGPDNGRWKIAGLDSDAIISRIMAHMTLDQKIGQMQMVEFLGTDYNTDLDNMINASGAGALIIYNNNTRTIPQMQQLLASVQARAQLPVMTALDQEGGDVNRLQEFYGPAPSAATMGAIGDPALARGQGALAAQRLRTLGFNTDLAPVVDVSDGGADIEGPRLWSTDPATTARLAGAFLDGLQTHSIAGCLKHWPGIGSIKVDPHKTLPTITHDLATLQAVDMAPFKALLSHQPAMIMSTDVMVPVLDATYPAEISPTLIDGILRQQLGYQGVIITDALIMQGIQQTWSMGEASVLAILAGDDLLETGYDTYSTQLVISAIHQAVTQGRISEARIDASVRRILRLKWNYGMGLDRLLAFAGPLPMPNIQAVAPSLLIGVGAATLPAQHRCVC